MYKIFINDKPLILVDNTAYYKEDPTSLFINSHITEEIRYGVEAIENQEHVKSIMVFHDDLDELWQTFKNDYREIEAAGGIVNNEKGEYLFISRNGKWDLPKGKIESGETPEEAATREVNEECSIGDLTITSGAQLTCQGVLSGPE